MPRCDVNGNNATCTGSPVRAARSSSTPPPSGGQARPRTWMPAAANTGRTASKASALSWFPATTTTSAPVARSASSVSKASRWASAGGAPDSNTSPATTARSTFSRSAAATISARTARCSGRRSTPFSTLPRCQSAVWRRRIGLQPAELVVGGGTDVAEGRRGLRRARGPRRERELGHQRHGDLGLAHEHGAGFGDGGPPAMGLGQEAVFGAHRFGGVEPAGDPQRRVGDDATLDLAGCLLGADQDHAEAATPLGHVQQDLLDRRAAFAWRVLVQLVEHHERERPGGAALLLVLERLLQGDAHDEALGPVVQ